MSGHLSSEQIEALAEGHASEEARVHAQSCPECAGAAEELGRYLAEIRSLRRLQAPPGFAARLRRRVDKETSSGWKALWSAVFLPLKIKVPLQLAGAGMATILLFWALPRWQHSLSSPAPEYAGAPARNEEELVLEPPRPPVPEELASDREAVPAPAVPKARARRAEPEKGTAPAPAPVASSPLAAGGAVAEKKEKAAASPPFTETLLGGLASKDEGVTARSEAGQGPARLSASRSAAPAAKPAAPASVPESPSKKQSAPESKTEEKVVSELDRMETRPIQNFSGAARSNQPDPVPAAAPVAAPPAAEIAEIVTSEQETALRALGFKAHIRGATKRMVLRIPAADWDSLRTRLREMGLEGRAAYLPTPPDSADVEVR